MRSDNIPKPLYEGFLPMLAVLVAVLIAWYFGNEFLNTHHPFMCR